MSCSKRIYSFYEKSNHLRHSSICLNLACYWWSRQINSHFRVGHWNPCCAAHSSSRIRLGAMLWSLGEVICVISIGLIISNAWIGLKIDVRLRSGINYCKPDVTDHDIDLLIGKISCSCWSFDVISPHVLSSGWSSDSSTDNLNITSCIIRVDVTSIFELQGVGCDWTIGDISREESRHSLSEFHICCSTVHFIIMCDNRPSQSGEYFISTDLNIYLSACCYLTSGDCFEPYIHWWKACWSYNVDWWRRSCTCSYSVVVHPLCRASWIWIQNIGWYIALGWSGSCSSIEIEVWWEWNCSIGGILWFQNCLDSRSCSDSLMTTHCYKLSFVLVWCSPRELVSYFKWSSVRQRRINMNICRNGCTSWNNINLLLIRWRTWWNHISNGCNWVILARDSLQDENMWAMWICTEWLKTIAASIIPSSVVVMVWVVCPITSVSSLSIAWFSHDIWSCRCDQPKSSCASSACIPVEITSRVNRLIIPSIRSIEITAPCRSTDP